MPPSCVGVIIRRDHDPLHGLGFGGSDSVDPDVDLFIIWTAWDIFKDSLNILLEGLPKGLNLAEVTREIRTVPRVFDVHDLHIWSLGSEASALSCHVVIEDMPTSESELVLADLNRVLSDRFHIHHATIQFEHTRCAAADVCAGGLSDRKWPATCTSPKVQRLASQGCYTEKTPAIRSVSMLKNCALFSLCAYVSLAAEFVTGQGARLVIGQTTFTNQEFGASAKLLGGVGAVAYANGKLYIADANRLNLTPINNRVLVMDTATFPKPTDEIQPYFSRCAVCVGEASLVLGPG